MRNIILYGSERGTTKRVVRKMIEHLSNSHFDIQDVALLNDNSIFEAYDTLIFVAPTYGDEELQADMEDFLVRCEKSKVNLSTKVCAVCELGNYYGYDDFVFGAQTIMYESLKKMGAGITIPMLSIDSLPKKDWSILERWCEEIERGYLNG